MTFKNRYLFLPVVLLMIMAGCSNKTNYKPDSETPGVAIFSNTGNNLLTCFTDGHSWRSQDRNSGFNTTYSTELNIRRTKTNSARDTLLLTWYGDDYNEDLYDIRLVMTVEKSFALKDFAALQSRRIILDSTNGYLVMLKRNQANPVFRGRGVIYFNRAYVNKDVSFSSTDGQLAGLIEGRLFSATGASILISSGRFDDNVGNPELQDF